ncbi:phage tail protein [Pedobacter agri]|uniref:phage tail protein n=1 Tax=Pedobacter agri TaxID=454586 RepID=UPI0029311A88|nr:tail fiber protein [Pedobacter agri]
MDFYLGDLRIVAINFAPKGWALCNGQLMSVQQNQALFTLLGTTYGGDGKTTFALPNLQGRVSLGFGQSLSGTTYTLGQSNGSQTVSLVQNQLPQHNHFFLANNLPGTTNAPGSNYFADSVAPDLDYSTLGLNTTMAPNAIAPAGNSMPLPIQQPYLGLNYIIAITGYFPSRN